MVSAMTAARRVDLLSETKRLFDHGFDSYMAHAYPHDELLPLSCTGRSTDRANPKNYGINDVCGNFSLTLVDTLSTLALLGDQRRFEQGIKDVIHTVTFDVDSKVQVFEVTIRLLGGLLSAHQYATEPSLGHKVAWYDDELLHLALDLGNRLLPAFDTLTGLPHARVNLRSGVPPDETTETCAAGAGSLVLEFAALSRLTGLSKFEVVARRAFFAVWLRRSSLNLVGNTLDVQTGVWTTQYTGIGAGVDSFYEYALKAWILLDDVQYYDVWQTAYPAIVEHLADPDHLYYKTIHLNNGFVMSNWIDSLSAFFPGLLVLDGRMEEAIKNHLIYYNLWQRYNSIPERFNYITKDLDLPSYPLRPEFVESTYYLYRSTRDPFYLHVGEQILHDLATMQTPCGFATLAHVGQRTRDDRMESFVLSETLKYLYLLFDESHNLHSNANNWVFTTEGHPLFLSHSRHFEQDSNITYIPRTCPVSETDSFYSATTSRSDFSYIQTLILPKDHQANTSYSPPPSHPQSTSAVVPIARDFEVFFGLANSLVNTSTNIVLKGKELFINSLQGLKIRFSYFGTQVFASKVDQRVIDRETRVIIRDSNSTKFNTHDIVRFTSPKTIQLDLLDQTYSRIQTISSIPSTHGSPLNTSTLRIISSLLGTNAQGCACPGILGRPNLESAILVFRGGCTFYEKVMNAHGAARMVIVIDPEGPEDDSIEPLLVDDEGVEMSSIDGYPSLVLVQGGQRKDALSQASYIRVRQFPQDGYERLLIKGEVVQNVRVEVK